jgi:hypothetical protein
LNRTQGEMVLPLQLPEQTGRQGMKRSFFHLCAPRDVEDRCGILFENELQAFRAAQKLAGAIAKVRPGLSGKAWISLTNDRSADTYCVSVQRANK